MKCLPHLRILVGAMFVLAATAKYTMGSAPLVAATIDLLGLPDSNWAQVERGWQAITLFELGLGVAMTFSSQRKHWSLALGAALAGFLAWDVARWMAGGQPDCGCFGGFSIASNWWHVGAKHFFLWAVAAVLLGSRTSLGALGGRR